MHHAVATPKAWTSVAAAHAMDLPQSWSDHSPPQQLQHISDSIKAPAKLREILTWSLERGMPTDHALPTVDRDTNVDERRSENPASNNSSPNKIVSESRHQATASKSDLFAAALNKISVLKSKKPTNHKPQIVQKVEVVTEECTSCFEDFPVQGLVRLSCTHYYCKPCLRTLIMTAIQTESKHQSLLHRKLSHILGSYPPKCCLSEIPADTVLVSG